MVRDILIWPDPILKQRALPVDKVDDGIRRLLDDMSETMYAADGVGLAAPQIGVLKRCIVIDASPRQEGQKLIHLVNPRIVRAEGETTYTEGCLSIPGEAEDVDRFAKVWVRALDYSGKEFEIEAEDLLCHRPPARDRPPRGHGLRRPPLQPEARAHPPAHEEAQGRARLRDAGRGEEGRPAPVGAVARRAGAAAATPTFGQSRATTQPAQSGLRAWQTRLPCQTSSWWALPHRSGGRSADRSSSTASGSVAFEKPRRRARRPTWVSTGKAWPAPRWTRTTPAVLRPTPGSASRASRVRGTFPP